MPHSFCLQWFNDRNMNIITSIPDTSRVNPVRFDITLTRPIKLRPASRPERHGQSKPLECVADSVPGGVYRRRIPKRLPRFNLNTWKSVLGSGFIPFVQITGFTSQG